MLRIAVPRGQHSGLLVGAAVNGDVKLWDVRKAALLSSIPNAGGLAACAVHGTRHTHTTTTTTNTQHSLHSVSHSPTRLRVSDRAGSAQSEDPSGDL